MRNCADEHRDAREGAGPMATVNKSTPSSLSPQNQRGTDRLQNNQEEYNDTGQLSKVGREHPQRKTWWDWVQSIAQLIAVIAIPLILGIATITFNAQQANNAKEQHKIDQVSADNQQQEATLQAYLDDMTKLIFDDKLGSQAVADKATSTEAAIVARAKTLTVLSRLANPQRKARVVQFLYESNLIGYYDPTHTFRHNPIIDLKSADLSSADLSGANLFGADLSGVNLHFANLRNANLSCASLSGGKTLCAILSNANLSGAILSNANLSGATLSSADLKGADLSSADLSGAFLNGATLSNANLSNANLSSATLRGAFLNGAILHNANLVGANLSGAKLRDAKGLAQQQLDQVYTCKGAILPQGLTCHKQP